MFKSRYVGELRSYRHGNPETAVMSLYSMVKTEENNRSGKQRQTQKALPLPVKSCDAVACCSDDRQEWRAKSLQGSGRVDRGRSLPITRVLQAAADKK